MRQWLRDLLIALSWANLCFLSVWSHILTYTHADMYFMEAPPSPTAYTSVFLDVLLLGGLLWGGIIMVRRSLHGWALVLAHRGFLLLLLIPLNALRDVLGRYNPYLKGELFRVVGESGVGLLLMGCVVICGFVLLRWPTKLTRMASACLLDLFPFVPVTCLQGIATVTHRDLRAFVPKPLAPLLPDAKTTPRVLWIIFDELDRRLVFDERPASIDLPEFDRFRRQALSASRVYSPSNATLTSLPSLISGRWVTHAEAIDADDLLVQFADAPEPVPLSQVPGVFTKARAAGFNTALIGFYHPYCRMLFTRLTSCRWYDLSMPYNSVRGALLYAMFDEARSLFETSTLSLFHQSLATRNHACDHQDFMEHAKRVAANPVYGLALLHFTIPHAPHFYDRTTRQPVLGNAPVRGYLDSLVLTDRALGQLRQAMERADLWDKTSIIISSDHSFRSAMALDGKLDRRIPFLLKLSGQATAMRYTQPFNSIITHDLILAILRRELVTPQDVVLWLDQRRMASPEAHKTFP
jgi:hypothetical protein